MKRQKILLSKTLFDNNYLIYINDKWISLTKNNFLKEIVSKLGSNYSIKTYFSPLEDSFCQNRFKNQNFLKVKILEFSIKKKMVRDLQHCFKSRGAWRHFLFFSLIIFNLCCCWMYFATLHYILKYLRVLLKLKLETKQFERSHWWL